MLYWRQKFNGRNFLFRIWNIITGSKVNIEVSEKEIRDKLDKVYIALGSKSNLIIMTSIEELFKFLKNNKIDKEICISITFDILLKLRGSIDNFKNKEKNIEIKTKNYSN